MFLSNSGLIIYEKKMRWSSQVMTYAKQKKSYYEIPVAPKYVCCEIHPLNKF